MQPETKKLGILLIEAGLITAAQLQDSLRHQRISGGRLGSTLVAQGVINEDCLMDFLAKQTGVPRLDVKNLEVPLAVLQRIPRRMAEQLTILPVAFKEPKSMVLAMADPMDLNAVDSARFASGMTIEPVVASFMAMKQAISENYTRLAAAPPLPPVPEAPAAVPDESLPVPFDFALTPVDRLEPLPVTAFPGGQGYARDPFFDPGPAVEPGPFSFFADPKSTVPSRNLKELAKGPAAQPPIIHQRSAMQEQVVPLENFGTRALVLGMIRLLQRRGILGQDELQRLLFNLIEAKEIDPDK
jgi:hypothetical protein